MCAPIPKGKWAWKYDQCVSCGTRKIKHKGRGLCLHCFDRKRGQDPKRREQVRIKHHRFYLKVKGTKKWREHERLRAKRWRDNESSGYKLLLQKIYLRGNLKRFLNRKRVLKRDLGGIKIRCDGCAKRCLVMTPIKSAEIKWKIQELALFKEILIENCGEKIKETSALIFRSI